MSRPILEIREGVGGWIVQTQHSEVPVPYAGTNAAGWGTCYEDRYFEVSVIESTDGSLKRGIRVTVWE